MTTIDTIYGTFAGGCKRRLDFTYYYEHPQVRSLYRIADLIQAVRFLDVGANIGIYSVYLSQLPSLATVDAFEPAQDSLRLLQQNCDLQPHRRITVHPLALSDVDETAEFAIYGELSGNNALLETTAKGAKPERVERIECTRLDGLARERNQTFVGKIDVEGHELKTIGGALDYLRGNTGLLQIECFDANRPELTAMLAAIGYRFLLRIQDDLYFSNISDPQQIAEIMEILYSEIATALQELKQFKVTRQRLNWDIRAALEAAGQAKDPVLSR